MNIEDNVNEIIPPMSHDAFVAKFIEGISRLSETSFRILTIIVDAAIADEPGNAERIDQYFHWWRSLPKGLKIPSEAHIRITKAIVYGEPFPEDLRQYENGGGEA